MKGRPRLVRLGGARAVAAHALSRVLDDDAYAAPALAAALNESGLDARDKGFATELFYGALRWAVPLEKSLLRAADKPQKGLDARIRPHLLVAAYQLQHLGERVPPHAAVAEAVEAVKAVRPGLQGFANALLRRLGSPPHAHLKDDAATDALADAIGVPPLLAAAVLEGVPAADRKRALLALNARPSLGLVLLDDAAPPAIEGLRPHPFVPGAFLVDGKGAPNELPGFDDGRLYPMDPGSAAVALLVAPAPGARVVDLCAAPGGKSLLLKRAVGAQGSVVSVEKQPRRAERIGENAARVKLAVDVRKADATKLTVDDVGGPVDAVLLDAPCTGFGTVRRKPEIKLRRGPDDVAAAAALQTQLLEAAARLVKPGGTLVYSVCTPIPDEGQRRIEAFLARAPGFSRVGARDVLPWLPADAVDDDGALRLRTYAHEADAFYACRLTRSR